jgi:hypothetical protein
MNDKSFEDRKRMMELLKFFSRYSLSVDGCLYFSFGSKFS